ncbi:ubiquitin-like domain-containing protein [Gorillibacterium sp. sgz5001074]|uniref:ubiquitin-like domain-containing protein n=1 Tax=Gorillibacterium sp. sgz5001074 TaxID=3446695 RepID=UPI003F66C06E
MAFALRWKHENGRLIGIAALIFTALAFMFFMLLYGTATKRVSVVVDGQETVMVTKSSVLQHLLDDKAIQVGEHDRISLPLDTKLKNGDAIVINHTSPIQLTADGKTVTLYTTGKTVAEALEDLNIQVGELDKVSPGPESTLASGADLKIVRVKKEVSEETVAIAYDTVTQNDGNLLKGKSQTVQEGVEGSKVVQTEKVYEDGVLVSENKVGETVKAESVSKVVAVGTKVPVVTVLSNSSPNVDEITKSGVKFGYKKVLNNVTLTAYSAGAASTGKDDSHPQFGLTYTGTTVTEGRTIAVDKNVIPLGWWVYIEGLGFRRAEDIGSGVKGNTIDVYFDSMSYATKFGTKRGYTVYVIGPKKPTVD